MNILIHFDFPAEILELVKFCVTVKLSEMVILSTLKEVEAASLETFS